MLMVSRRNLATCSADTTIKIWSANSATSSPTDTGYTLEKVLQGHQRWVWDMAYSADSAYLVSGAFHGDRCPSARKILAANKLSVYPIIASSDHTARLWELASGTTVRQVSVVVCSMPAPNAREHL